jgi:hypothetical protein
MKSENLPPPEFFYIIVIFQYVTLCPNKPFFAIFPPYSTPAPPGAASEETATDRRCPLSGSRRRQTRYFFDRRRQEKRHIKMAAPALWGRRRHRQDSAGRDRRQINPASGEDGSA